jgi:N utilization substance protein B
MALTRSELRERIMTIIYQIDFYIKNKIDYDINEVIKENIEIDNEFVKKMVHGVMDHLEEIDSIANDKLSDWTIDRLDAMGEAILRMAIYELKYEDTPDLVVINEAIELSKKYCDEAVRKMINAVLDKYIKE